MNACHADHPTLPGKAPDVRYKGCESELSMRELTLASRSLTHAISG